MAGKKKLKKRYKQDPSGSKNTHAVALGKLGGRVGGPARAAALSPERRSAIARMGAKVTNASVKGKPGRSV